MKHTDGFVPNIYRQNPEIFDKVILLTKKQQQEPTEVFRVFFQERLTLSEVRANLSELLNAVMTTPSPEFEDHLHRANVSLFCREMEVLIEAAFLLKANKK